MPCETFQGRRWDICVPMCAELGVSLTAIRIRLKKTREQRNGSLVNVPLCPGNPRFREWHWDFAWGTSLGTEGLENKIVRHIDTSYISWQRVKVLGVFSENLK